MLPAGSSGEIVVQGICRDGLCVSKNYTLSTTECAIDQTQDAAGQSVDGARDSDAARDGSIDAATYRMPSLAAPDPCEEAVCGVGELCDRDSGRCVDRSFRRPGGACADSGSAPLGRCLTEAEFGFTGGFVRRCSGDAMCEADAVPRRVTEASAFGAVAKWGGMSGGLDLRRPRVRLCLSARLQACRLWRASTVKKRQGYVGQQPCVVVTPVVRREL